MLLADLGGVDQGHHLAGAAHHGAFDGGFVGVGRGQSVGCAQAVGSQDGDVDPQGGQGLDGFGADGGLGESAQLTAQDPHPGASGAGQPGGGQNGVGDDGQVGVARQEAGERPGGGSGVDEEGGAGLRCEPRQGGSGDGLLGGGVDLLALGHAGLRQGGGGDGAAVDLAQGAVAVQGSQVAADRLRGDVEVLGELGDENPPRTAHLLHDLAVPVLNAHVHLLEGPYRQSSMPVRASNRL